jgi:hypothetical protein
MKFAHKLSFVLCTMAFPAIALADDPSDPYAPTVQPAPSTTTTIVSPAPAPAPQQQPVVVVNPEPRPTTTMVVAPQSEGTEVYDQWNAPVFATGALVFLGSYGASAVVAGSSDHVGADRLYVPVVGPWLALNDWGDCPIEQPRCDKNTTDKVLLVADGVFQAAGLVTMVSGLLSPSHHTVYTRTAMDTKTHVTPTHNGFAVIGRF